MKADGRRVTTPEQAELFAEQEQQSDESEMLRRGGYNSDDAPGVGHSLLHHNGPEQADQRYVPIIEVETSQILEIQTMSQDAPNLQRQMAEYRPGHPLCHVFRWGMPEFRLQFLSHQLVPAHGQALHLAENLLRPLLDGNRHRRGRPDYRRPER